MFKIETNVRYDKSKEKSKYPFDKMDVGDSFEFDKKFHEKIRVACFMYGKRHGRKYLTQKTEQSKYRCWRME